MQKGVFPYEYMDSWEKFNETLSPGKECLIINKINRSLYIIGLLEEITNNSNRK